MLLSKVYRNTYYSSFNDRAPFDTFEIIESDEGFGIYKKPFFFHWGEPMLVSELFQTFREAEKALDEYAYKNNLLCISPPKEWREKAKY